MPNLRALVCGLLILAPACSQGDAPVSGMNCAVAIPKGANEAIAAVGVYDYFVRLDGADGGLALIACTEQKPLSPRTNAGPDMPVVKAKGRMRLSMAWSPDGLALNSVRIVAPVDVSVTEAMKKPGAYARLEYALESPLGDGAGLLDGTTMRINGEPTQTFSGVTLRYNIRTEKEWAAKGWIDATFHIDADSCIEPAATPLCQAIYTATASFSTMRVEFLTKQGDTLVSAEIPVTGRTEALEAASAKLKELEVR